MKTINFNGKALDQELNNAANPDSDLREFSKVYELSSQRSTAQKAVKLSCNDDDVLVLEYEDGMEWITRADNLDDQFMENTGTRGSTIRLAPGLSIPNQRGLGKIALKLVNVFVKKKIVKKAKEKLIRELGISFDEKFMPRPGLFLLNSNFIFETFDPKKAEKKKRYLLLIHGFVSKTHKSFNGLIDDEQTIIWNQLQSIYGDRILAYDHKTISKSPIENALELLKSLPPEIELDLFSLSRGGLVSDLISLASALGKDSKFVINKSLIENKSERSLLSQFIKLARIKKIKLRRALRVSCPANGTKLLSKRLDLFLNGVLGAVGLAVGSKANPFYQVIKSFVMDVVGEKQNVSVFPGIAAMHPDSDFLKLTNTTKIKPQDELLVVEGDSEIGRKFFRSLAVIITNLLHSEANDLIVHTDSMRFGLKRKDGVRALISEDHDITHFRYLIHGKTKSAIYHALKWDSKVTLKGFDHFSYEELSDQLANDINRKKLRDGASKKRTDTEDLDIITHLFGSDDRSRPPKYVDKLNIKLLHSDLVFARYPVLVGHFSGDEILSAERALDKQLDGKLSDRFLTGNYPNNKESVEVVLTPSEEHKGGIVVGLGESADFTESELRTAVRNATLAYAIEMRDKYRALISDENKKGISPLFIGSSYGGLNMQDSLSAILFGISEANRKINELNERNYANDSKKLIPITEIQFVDIFENVVKKAFHKLKELDKHDFNLNIKLPSKIDQGAGCRKQIEYYDKLSFWHNIMTEIEANPDNKRLHQIQFRSSSGKAKIQEVTEYFSKDLINKIIAKFSSYSLNQNEITGLLYNLLIPKKIKYELRNYPNVQWKMDMATAEYPWEMLHDKANDQEPIFVNSGLVRQLISKADFPYEKITRTQTALVIGDPIYTSMNPLPYAEKEASLVNDMLTRHNWNPNYLPKKDLLEIVTALHGEYKLLHIAGHGVYDIESERGGIVVEDTILDSHFFKSLPCLPEFAFINCCYSGSINPEFEKQFKHRYKLAASLGMQLIEQGVEAVIITGWAVDDEAAMEFAEAFYEDFLITGSTFGEAVKKARKTTYSNYPRSITWGAYQCYGNPNYLIDRDSYRPNPSEFNDEENQLVELYNIKSSCIDKSAGNIKWIKRRLEKIKTDEADSGILTPRVLEKIAEIYFEINDIEAAKNTFIQMMEVDKAEYSVKSIEQYCNLLIKLKFKEYIEKAQNDNLEEFILTEEEVEILLANFSNLLKISDTAERQALYASAYKRFAYILDKQRTEFLDKMVDHYYLGSGVKGKRKVYQYTNFLQGKYLIDAKYQDSKSKEVINALSELKEIKAQLSTPTHKDFWTDIEIVNILTTELLFKTNTTKIKEEIIATYEFRFTRRGTLKNLQSEIEQFEFLKKMMKDLKLGTKSKVQAIEDIYNALVQIQNKDNE